MMAKTPKSPTPKSTPNVPNLPSTTGNKSGKGRGNNPPKSKPKK
jgi:hypothetical protein